MFFRTVAPLIAIVVALAGCSGGGGGAGPATSALPAPLAASQPQTATGTLTIGSPQSGTASNLRKPTIVSPSSTFATLWIDDIQNGRIQCVGDGLFGAQCAIVWASTSGPHLFTVAVDDSTSFSGGGTVLGVYSQGENLAPGPNTLPSITLSGVVAQVKYLTEVAYAPNDPNCSGGSPGVNCIVTSELAEDADDNAISPPATLDHLVSLDTSNDNIAQLFNPHSFDTGVTCAPGANGTFTITAYSSFDKVALTAAELAFLVYPNQNPLVVTGFPSYSCSNGTISAFGPAGGSVTVQSAPKKL
jgi:hypothetical protein